MARMPQHIVKICFKMVRRYIRTSEQVHLRKLFLVFRNIQGKACAAVFANLGVTTKERDFAGEGLSMKFNTRHAHSMKSYVLSQDIWLCELGARRDVTQGELSQGYLPLMENNVKIHVLIKRQIAIDNFFLRL